MYKTEAEKMVEKLKGWRLNLLDAVTDAERRGWTGMVEMLWTRIHYTEAYIAKLQEELA